MKRIYLIRYSQENGSMIIAAWPTLRDARDFVNMTPTSATNGESYDIVETILYEEGLGMPPVSQQEQL